MSLSILIPTFNDECRTLVVALARQAQAVEGLQWEIIVADDGSTDPHIVEANKEIERLEHCSYIIRCENSGRAAIRNFLAREAHYERLLFVDADMQVVRADFVQRYLDSDAAVIYGGYTVGKGTRDNLRYRYEKASEPAQTAERRAAKPFQDFHTSNFMIQRTLMLTSPFDERFQHYGYEDVIFGKQFQEKGIQIQHIDNPTGFCTFEDNAHFVAKTEEGLRTLHRFSDELEGYSQLLHVVNRLRQLHLLLPLRLLLQPLSPALRRNLCGNKPSLRVFKWYKLAYYLMYAAQAKNNSLKE